MSLSHSRHSRVGGNPEKLITDNLDIWTSAIKNKASTGRGSNKKQELYGIKKLRELILELAVRGLLVPQDPNDEPANVLLEKISAEKALQEKDGRIKKEKKLLPVSEEELTFTAPQGWVWSRMGDLAQYQKGYAFKSKDYIDCGVMITKIQNLTENHIRNSVYIAKEKATEFDQYLLSEGDLVMTTVGSWFSAPVSAVGRSFLINKLFDNSLLNQNAVRIRSWKWLNPTFLFICVNSPLFKNYLVQEAQGTANQASITQLSIKNFLVCVPPKDEQQRIVAKVDELMALCDQLEQQTETSLNAHQTLVETLLKALLDAAQSRDDASAFEQAWQRIADHFDVLFTTEQSIDQLKQTILQLAVMGKLVPQDPNDEPASVLLERIAAEKERLVKEGKIKKQKKSKPFDINEEKRTLPCGWCESDFGDITFNRDAERIPLSVSERKGRSGRYDYYGASGVIDHIDDFLFDKPLLLIGEDGANLVNRSTPIAFMAYGEYWVNNHAHVIDGLTETFLKYLALYINSISLLPYITGMAQPKMNQAKMNSIPVWLPPEKEMHKVLEKVDQLFMVCDSLKARIRESKNTQLHLADAMAEQALA